MTQAPEYLTLMDVLSLFGGGTVIVSVLLGFLGKTMLSRITERVKSEYNGDLKRLETDLNASLEALKAKNASSIHVHKMQFEKEFTEYQELWKKAVVADRCFRALQTQCHIHYSYKEILDAYYESYRSLLMFNLNAHPFYYEGIHNISKDLILEFSKHHEVLENHERYQKSRDTNLEGEFDSFDFDYLYGHVKQADNGIGELMRLLSREIRQRWQSMVLIDENL